MKLFDTDVLIEHLKGNQAATTLLLEASDTGQAACSVLTRFELLAGMPSNERSEIRGLLASMNNIEASVDVATRAGEWARTYRRSHEGISPIDYLIAATAEVHGADLLTQNVKHFPMFPELEPAVDV
ncbi:MAG TPA: type II toxin-antitoxin system VapC family toxin [Acidimicrobiia bacterium]|nr:type II toxin-antitoxin system VapC family toxin [Acidimicrobiia bacterium]